MKSPRGQALRRRCRSQRRVGRREARPVDNRPEPTNDRCRLRLFSPRLEAQLSPNGRNNFGGYVGKAQFFGPSEIGLGYRPDSALVPVSYAEQHIGKGLGSR